MLLFFVFNQPSTAIDTAIGQSGVLVGLMEVGGYSLGKASPYYAAATTGWSIGSWLKSLNLRTKGTIYTSGSRRDLD